MAFNENNPQLPMPQLVTKILIRVKCRNLLDKDVTSKSDPMVVMHLPKKTGQGIESWVEVARSENIKNSLNPDFVKSFEVDYYFEEVQKLAFRVYDLDNKTPDLSDDDYLGGVEITLSQIVSQTPLTKPLTLFNGTKAGQGVITLIAEEESPSRDNLHVSFQGRGLDKKDFFGKSDPFLEISRRGADGSWLLVHRTEVIKNNLNPSWKTFVLAGTAINSRNLAQELKIDCFDFDDDGGHDLIGETLTTVGEMMKASNVPVEWSSINHKKKQKKGSSYRDSGKIILQSCKVVTEYTFLDYIFGGCQLNFTVGIDFTASNGKPRDPGSLHYYRPGHSNEYMQAISAVGAIIQDYDSDKMFPALGFGARIPPSAEVYHEFALNFDPSNPFCNGVQGILEAYMNCLPRVQLYGPTNIAPIIHHVARFAASASQQPTAASYFVLLILTDGVITDMNDAKAAIVYASQLPMSIIIVGVGKADFKDMCLLDGDNGVLRGPDGTPAARDIVQFVPYRKFHSCGDSNSPESGSLLSKEVLAEVPKQVSNYFNMRGLPPSVQQTQPT